LLAAFHGGNTSIFALGEDANKSLCPCHKRTVIVIRSYGSFILPFTLKMGVVEHFSKKMPNQELFPGWAFCIFRSFPHYKSLDLWVIVRIVGNRWIYMI
jgi:hypothetical protein